MSSSSTTHYDVIILGSGQSGTPLASAFAGAGKKTCIVDRAHISGTCINEGCTPTKTMIASGRVAYLARRGAEFGVHYSGGGGGEVAVDMKAVRQRKRDIVNSWREGGEKRLERAGVEYLKGEGTFTGERTLAVAMKDGSGGTRAITGDVVLINVGESPSRPDVPGLGSVDQSRVLNSTSIMELDVVPEHLVVLGGGYIALEFGQLFRRLGAAVTIIQHGTQLAPKEDADVAKNLLDILTEDGMVIHLSTECKSIEATNDKDLPIGLNITSKDKEDGKSDLVKGSHLLLATGRVPNTKNLNLDKAGGVKTTARGHIVVNDKLETGAPGTYALGDCHGGPAFTHISYDDFRVLRQNLLASTVPATTPRMATTAASTSRGLTPYVMYTDPQLAHVGLHDADLDALAATGRRIKVAAMPWAYVARALETAEARGMMKASVDAETGEILGFTCLGVEGGEIMAVVQTAMMGNVKWYDLEAAVWAHPSFAESLNNLWGYLQDRP
jgi:pyruvate/2-oxoglutarate dehydrogenase complex dihydrolipoamide dehydrogenase (E3) component